MKRSKETGKYYYLETKDGIRRCTYVAYVVGTLVYKNRLKLCIHVLSYHNVGCYIILDVYKLIDYKDFQIFTGTLKETFWGFIYRFKDHYVSPRGNIRSMSDFLSYLPGR